MLFLYKEFNSTEMFLLAVLSISLSIFAIFAQEDGDLRTVSERLEIFEYGEWGTVCSKGFDDVDARVAYNIDYNPSRISSKGSFHGTKISLFQHISEDIQDVVQTFDQSEPMLKCQSKRVSLQIFQHRSVLRFNEPDIPLVEGEISIDMSSFPAAIKGGFKWLKHVAENASVTNIS
ncbi:unnamed protein product [Mytilus edulis]|uniref:Uncharacterized protein n=1 Tax=Mytilus edulis TaxID=6550 RepID=A0A8S3SPY1_MYTED|nr:unnamed protein product [Mytilus edulis]